MDGGDIGRYIHGEGVSFARFMGMDKVPGPLE